MNFDWRFVVSLLIGICLAWVIEATQNWEVAVPFMATSFAYVIRDVWYWCDRG